MEDALKFYKNCVKQLLSTYESDRTENSQVELLFDDERMRYMAVRVGWANRKWLHLCLVHIDIVQDQIVIQCNNTEDVIATELEKMGVSPEKISIGFLPPEVRAILNTAKEPRVLQAA